MNKNQIKKFNACINKLSNLLKEYNSGVDCIELRYSTATDKFYLYNTFNHHLECISDNSISIDIID